MCRLVCNDDQFLNYSELLYFLNSVDFEYRIPMDENRLKDGENLRYLFQYYNHIPDHEIERTFSGRKCSVLEMMVALSHRCEESIMDDLRYGDRTGVWFWSMIKSLGLDYMTNYLFDEKEAHEIINRFLERDYDRTGRGGLFTVHGIREDMRKIDIWSQMNWYLEQIE